MSPPLDELKILEALWYARLKESGFDDIEDHSMEDKPLKRWSGIPATRIPKDGSPPINIIDIFYHQEAGEPIQSSFPQKLFCKEEHLLNQPDFDEICETVCEHGNNRIDASVARQIWERHTGGESIRVIAAAVNRNYVTVYRCIVNLTKWSEGMGEEAEVSTVVVREYDPERDAAMLFSTWRNALWFDLPERDETKNHKFFRESTRMIKSLLAEPGAKVLIACLSDDPDLIMGTAVMNKENLLWVYVKADYRSRGIATLLTKDAKTVSQPSTKIGKAIARDKGLKIHGKD